MRHIEEDILERVKNIEEKLGIDNDKYISEAKIKLSERMDEIDDESKIKDAINDYLVMRRTEINDIIFNYIFTRLSFRVEDNRKILGFKGTKIKVFLDGKHITTINL